MGEILIPRRTKVEKGYELLADIVVRDNPVTNVDITGLNIGKGDEVVLVSSFLNVGTGQEFQLFVNGNTTRANYYFQEISANGTVISSARYNWSQIFYPQQNSSNFSTSNIKLTNSGYFVSQTHSIGRVNTTTPYMVEDYLTSTFNVSAITSLAIASYSSNSIGIGSRFQLYKIGGA